ncbi:MAG: thiamine diphosphokinase [Candidatus Zixiibacteriota bacterium]|nr:MAG: thiamine diphosphokinase [candidate division Zixibacteria bacterium]
MKDCIIFLRGVYRTRDLDHYRRLCRGKFTIAANGGYAFFAKAGITPDLIIGDLDSLRGKGAPKPKEIQVVVHPAEKDATDAEIALDYCLNQRVKKIDIVQPSTGEPDHFAGNLMLLTRSVQSRRSRYRPSVRLLSRSHEVFLLKDQTRVFRDSIGDLISVLPVSGNIRLSCSGMEYTADCRTIRRGRTIGLRNRICARLARIEVEGQALVFHGSANVR